MGLAIIVFEVEPIQKVPRSISSVGLVLRMRSGAGEFIHMGQRGAERASSTPTEDLAGID